MESKVRSVIVKDCQALELALDFNDSFEDLEVLVGKGASLALRIYNFGSASNKKITANIEENGEISAVMADFSSGQSMLEARINLNGINARGTWKLSSLASGDDDKKFNVYFLHNAPQTDGLMTNYGVARNSSRLIFSGANSIIRGAKKSKTRQNAKIIVFDEGATAKADPRLSISENEVEASHAAIVGKLNDEHLFYLMSRGLNLNEAKKLITYGYLMPIASYFKEDVLQTKIAQMIEERL
ncbi:MAG: SufD family Fe-S cluster assembly protein [Bacilli bacterium]|jgi:Fe-S cluster assembly protein SufD